MLALTIPAETTVQTNNSSRQDLLRHSFDIAAATGLYLYPRYPDDVTSKGEFEWLVESLSCRTLLSPRPSCSPPEAARPASAASAVPPSARRLARTSVSPPASAPSKWTSAAPPPGARAGGRLWEERW